MIKVGFPSIPGSDVYKRMNEFNPDYVEANFSTIATATDEKFDDMLKSIDEIKMPVLRANGFFSIPEIIIVGENTMKDEDMYAYLEKGFTRAKKIGIEVAVWGSGASRKCPEGFLWERAVEQMLHYGKIIDEVADKYGVKVAIEPLNYHETNMIRTVKECVDFVKLLGGKNIFALADSYHMCVEEESFDTLKDYKEYLVHTHIAEAEFGTNKYRRFPDEKDELGIKKFVDALRNMNYEGCLTIEAGGRGGDWSQEVIDAIKTVKKWAQQ